MAPAGRHRAKAFTLIELLAVITIIGILAGILIPVVGGAITSAKNTRTRAQFAQWAAAIEGFRQEYGYYPRFGAATTGAFADGLIDDAETTATFVQTLTGRGFNGEVLDQSTDPGVEAGNTKRIRFCTFTDEDFNDSDELQDAFGSSDIVVLVDRNLDGRLTFGTTNDDYDMPDLPKIGSAAVNPTSDWPTDGIRAGVVFYSPGAGESAADIVKSW